MHGTAYGCDIDIRHPFKQVNGFHICPVNGIQAPGFQAVAPGIDIGDGQGLHLGKIGLVWFEIIGIALCQPPYPGFPGFQNKGTCADTLVPVIPCRTLRIDPQMVIPHDERKVCTAFCQFKCDFIITICLDVGDAFQKRFGSRFGFFSPVVVDGKHHILNGHGFAVVEFNPFAQLEGPFVRFFGGFPGFSQFRNRLKIVVDLHQAVAQLA